MTQFPLDPGNRPSWLGPIFVTSLVTVLVQILIGSLVGISGGCVSGFVCCASILPLGFLPVVLVAPKDPLLRSGEGFVLSFVAVGVGATVMAAMNVFQSQGVDTTDLESSIRESISGMPDNEFTQEQIDQAVSVLVDVAPYVPILFAAVMAVMAGAVGAAATAWIVRRRSPHSGIDNSSVR